MAETKLSRTVDAGLLILRVGVGLVLMYFGTQKLFGAFGGPGFSGTLEMFGTSMGIPKWLGVLAIFAEFFGGLGLIVGFLTRIAAFGTGVTMAVALAVNFSKSGGFTALAKGSPPQALSGIGFTFALTAASLAVLLMGPGDYSIDAKLFGRKHR